MVILFIILISFETLFLKNLILSLTILLHKLFMTSETDEIFDKSLSKVRGHPSPPPVTFLLITFDSLLQF